MRYSIEIKFLVFFLFILTANLSAQIYPSHQISSEDGLPSDQIESIFKDSRGILWIGTSNGLSKVENGKIKNFYTEDGIAHNNTWDIQEDENNNIWIASYGGGITKFDGKNFTVFNEAKGLVNNFVRKIVVFNKQVFIGTKDGISVLNTKNDSISTIKTTGFAINDIGEQNFQVMDFFTHKNEIYVGTFRHGIFKINLQNNQLKKVFNFKSNLDALFSIYKNDSILYYGIDGASTNLIKGSFKKFKIEKLLNDDEEELVFGHSVFWDYATDQKNNVYGAAWGVNGKKGGIFQIKNDSLIDKSIEFGVESSDVKSLFFDPKFNFLYVGTLNKGVYEIDLSGNVTYFKNENLNIVDIEYSKEEVVFLTKKGLKIISNNKITKQVSNVELLNYSKNYYLKYPTKQINRYPYLRNKTNTEDVLFFKLVLNNNSYWVSSNIGLFQLELDLKIKNYFPIATREFEFDVNGKMISPIPYSDSWVFNQLSNFTTNNEVLSYDAELFLKKDVNTPEEVTNFRRVGKKVFISTIKKGLFIYENEKFSSLAEKGVFNEMELKYLAFSEALNQLVIGTASGELYLADVTKEFKIVKKVEIELRQGRTLSGIGTYKDYIIIGTNKGLLFYRNDTWQFIDHDQGLVKHELTAGRVVGDELIVGTNEGYYVFNLPKILDFKRNDVALHVNNITINNQPVVSNLFNWFNLDVNYLELHYKQNNIFIDFKASNHPYPDKLRYKYQVKGLDSTWSNYSNNTQILLHYLPAGKFDILLKTSDLSSGEEYSDNLLSLKVEPPFWLSPYFIALIVLDLFVLVLILYFLRIRTIKQRAIKKVAAQNRLSEIKLEALQSQMNPHFTFNAMNSIQNYIIDNDIDNALMYLSEFAKLIRQTLDNCSHTRISLENAINYLITYVKLENMRFNNKIAVDINYKGLPVMEIMIPPMLIQPFVENVFVHAFDKDSVNPKLTIDFKIVDEQLQVRIIDNGKGIVKNSSRQQHQSKGLKMVRERLKLLNNSDENNLIINSNDAGGTTVLLNLKLQSHNEYLKSIDVNNT